MSSRKSSATVEQSFPVMISRPLFELGNSHNDFSPSSPDDMPHDFLDMAIFERYRSLDEAITRARQFNEIIIRLHAWFGEEVPAWCFVLVPLGPRSEQGRSRRRAG